MDNLFYFENDSAEMYRNIVEEVHEGSAVIDKEGRLIFANSSFAGLIGIVSERIPGHNLLDYIEASSLSDFIATMNQACDGVQEQQVRIRKVAGPCTEVLMTLHPLALKRTRVLSIIVTELTSQIRYARALNKKGDELTVKNIELIKTNNELSEFLYASNHDLQEPLRKIQIFLNLLIDEEYQGLSEKGKDYFQRVLKSTQRMQSMLCDLSLYSDIRKRDLAFENIDLSILADEVIKDYFECIIEKNIRIVVHPLPIVKVIRVQFRQLLHNLIGNAIKFSANNHESCIEITHKKVRGEGIKELNESLTYERITVTDNGIGFENAYSEKIFELFRRLHHTEDYNSTGIGLPLCKRVASNHDGTITATGQPGRGASFNVFVLSR